MTDDKLYDVISKGAQAKALLESDLLMDCFNVLDRAYIDAWRLTPARDTLTREKLWMATNVVGKVREHLIKVFNDGKLAQTDINMRNAVARKAA